jgi:hypothetical protein
MASPGRPRFKQYVAGRRLLRNQYILLTEEEFERERESILARVKMGILEVVYPGGEILRLKNEFVISVHDTIPAPVEEFSFQEEEEAAPIVGNQEADFTLLPHIGGGRAKRLRSHGILNYSDLIRLGHEGLIEIFGASCTWDMAEAIINKAKELV